MKQTLQSEKKIFLLKDRNGNLRKNWYIEVLVDGKRIAKKYEGINQGRTVAERMQRARKLMRKLKKEAGQVPRNIDQKGLLYKVLMDSEPFLEKKSFQTYSSKINQLFDWLSGDEITTERLQAYFVMYRREHTQTGTYDCRRQLMTYFKKAGIAHLLAPIKIKKGIHQPLRYFQPHQCQEILHYLKRFDPKMYLHCLFIYYLAIRPRKELIHLRPDDIFYQERKVAIRGEIAKTDESLFIKIPPKFYPILEPLQEQKPNTYIFSQRYNRYKPAGTNTYGERFRGILNKFGYGKNYQLYSWKHTGCVAVYKSTKNLLALRDHCRHKDATTTQKYLRQLGLEDYPDFYENFPSPIEWK